MKNQTTRTLTVPARPGLACLTGTAVILALWSATPQALAAPAYLVVPATRQVLQFNPDTGEIARKLEMPISVAHHNSVLTESGELLVAGNDALSVIDSQGELVRTYRLNPPAVAVDETKTSGTKTASSSLPKVSVRTESQKPAPVVLQVSAPQPQHVFGLDYERRTGTAYLGVQSRDGRVTIYRLNLHSGSLEILATYDDIARPRDLVVSGDGLRIYLSAVETLPEPAARVYPINPLGGARGGALAVTFDPARPELSLSADGNLLYLIAADDSLQVINTRSNAIARRLRPKVAQKGQRISRVIPAPDNRHLWVLTDKSLSLWDALENRLVQSKDLPMPTVDVAVSHENTIWSLHPVAGHTQLQRWENNREQMLAGAHYDEPVGVNRLLFAEVADARTGTQPLLRVAVVGFETGPVRYGRFPNVAEIVAGNLLRTRRYQIVPPRQIKSVLETLELSSTQLQADPGAIRQVASLVGADVVLVGSPLRVGMPNRDLESLAGLLSPYAAFLLPQLSSPRVFTGAEAFDRAGQSLWKAEVVNHDDPFFSGKPDATMLSNAMVITGEDIANRFSKSSLKDLKTPAELPLPSQQDLTRLKDVRRIALLGPDLAVFNRDANRAESLGHLIAAKLGNALGWEVSNPDETFGRLAELGIEPQQLPTTDPKLLARTLGVDAVMTGMVRSSTYVTGGFLGMGRGAAADVVLQYELTDQQGRVLWNDTQVRNLPADLSDDGRAIRQATDALVEGLKQGLK